MLFGRGFWAILRMDIPQIQYGRQKSKMAAILPRIVTFLSSHCKKNSPAQDSGQMLVYCWPSDADDELTSGHRVVFAGLNV